MNILRASIFALASTGLAACDRIIPAGDITTEPAELMPLTETGLKLENLAAPARALDVAVYAFPDLTGANEHEDDYAELSRAVTQGGAHLLVDVLRSAGDGKWFDVSERTRVDNLLREREIIERTQMAFNGRTSLPALRFAGTLIEGAIIGYDSNEITGGAGANYLGIGGFTEYREDVVTVSLRAVSVSTGRVLTSVTTTKTVYSVLVSGGLYQFVALDEILQVEAGVSRNEPEIFAVREAMELGVLAMIVEGAENGQWKFKNQAEGQRIIDEYRERYDGVRKGLKPQGGGKDTDA